MKRFFAEFPREILAILPLVKIYRKYSEQNDLEAEFEMSSSAKKHERFIYR